jgi:hypothetical protein
MAKKVKSKASSAMTKVGSKRGKGTQPEAAVHKGHQWAKVASRRVGGAQRSAQQRQQKKRDSR